MLKPADGIEGIKEAVMTAVRDARSQCLSAYGHRSGDQGTFEKCALMAKKALTRSVGSIPIFLMSGNGRRIAAAYQCLRHRAGSGLAAECTALAVHIDTYPTHIAGLPVGINICCHVNLSTA